MALTWVTSRGWNATRCAVPYFPRRAISPNDRYAALVAAAGYLPLTLARVLDELLTPAQAGRVDRTSARVAARTRVAATAHRPLAARGVQWSMARRTSWTSGRRRR